MAIFILWMALSLFVGAYASSKKVWGGFFMSFLVSMIFSPVIGLLAVVFTKPSEEVLLRSGMKKCPFCAELIKSEAIVCKHCGKELPKNEEGADKVGRGQSKRYPIWAQMLGLDGENK